MNRQVAFGLFLSEGERRVKKKNGVLFSGGSIWRRWGVVVVVGLSSDKSK